MTKAIPKPGFRARLRRAMPRVAVAAAILFVLRSYVVSDAFVEKNPLGSLLDVVTTLTVLLSAGYYGPKAIRWLWRKILWRVRRRLVITYLFVGLTPIVLMGAFGLLGAYVTSAEAMAKEIRQELRSTEDHVASSAARLARELLDLIPRAGEGALQSWLQERGAFLRTEFPGARIAVWRGTPGEKELGASSTPFVAPADDGGSPPLGPGAPPAGSPLPSWLRTLDSFHGLTFAPPPRGSDSRFGSASIRALARGDASGRPFAVLVAVPMSRSLVERLRGATHMEVQPFFLKGAARADGGDLSIRSKGPGTERPGRQAGIQVDDFGAGTGDRLDQLGEPLPPAPYPVTMSATDWETGVAKDHLAFYFSWSWTEAVRQFLGGSVLGRFWKLTFIAIVGAFLGMELLALLAAVLITREVTGTVHELQLATEAVRRGDFSYRARKRSHDQLGELADAFNDMSGHIETLLDDRVKHELLEREIEIAAEVQSKLFPRSMPRMLTTEITGECRAARGVAGDYYDYLSVAPGLAAFALADVSGKGISASLLMSNLQASLRAQAGILKQGAGDGAILPAGAAGGPAADGAVARLASSLNAQLCRSTDTNRYATLFLGLYDERARVLRYTNAGHNAAVLVQADGSVKRLSLGGTIVGAFDEAVYTESLAALGAGAVLLVFSDGISEAENAEGVEFGEDRIAAFAVANRHHPAEEMRRRLFAEVDRWSQGVERNDDQTLVIVRALDGAA